MNKIGYYDPNRFTKLSDGWIRDNMPGNEREWGPSSPVVLGPEERKKFCADLGGSEPEAHESASIVNYEGENGFFPIFADTKTDDCYATKTEVAWGRGVVRVVHYSLGCVGYYDKGGRYYVRPVRTLVCGAFIFPVPAGYGVEMKSICLQDWEIRALQEGRKIIND